MTGTNLTFPAVVDSIPSNAWTGARKGIISRMTDYSRDHKHTYTQYTPIYACTEIKYKLKQTHNDVSTHNKHAHTDNLLCP